MEEDKEVPFGATPKEVADDIPIMASENEYVIPANVVRFLGLEKIEKMVSKAKEALAAMGEVVGEDESDGMVEDNELPFDPSELQAVPHMAEGGVVGDFAFPQQYGYTGVKEVKNADGNSMFVPYVNGAPLFAIPEGYSEAESQEGDDPTSVAQETAQRAINPVAGLLDNSANENGRFVEQNESPLAGNPNSWTVDDFIDFGRQRNSVGNNAIKGMINMLPGGKLATRAREKWLDRAVSSQFDNMLESGLDPMGNPITPEQRTQLLSTRENLKTQMSNDAGLDFSPIESLTNAVQRFTAWAGEGIVGNAGAPRSSLNEAGTAMVSGSDSTGRRISSGSDRMGANLPQRSSSDDQYSGTHLGGTANSDGTPSRSALDNTSSYSGGLYAEGGLVTRRKKKK